MSPRTTRSMTAGLAPTDAACHVIRELLLERLEGFVPGGKAADRLVRLKKVYATFPTKMDGFEPPCASVSEISNDDVDDECDYLDDAEYDDALEQAPQITEASGEVAIDIWGKDPAERHALKAALLALFRLPELATYAGKSILVDLPEEAIPPQFRGRADFVPKLRLELRRVPKDIDDSVSAERHEWRAQAQVAWDAQIITAADAERLDVLTQSTEVVDLSETAAT